MIDDLAVYFSTLSNFGLQKPVSLLLSPYASSIVIPFDNLFTPPHPPISFTTLNPSFFSLLQFYKSLLPLLAFRTAKRQWKGGGLVQTPKQQVFNLLMIF